MHNRELLIDFNEMIRGFHQACSIPDEEWIDKLAEGQLAQYMKQSLYQISKAGMDIEMANLRVKQDKISILNLELTHGLPLERNDRGPRDAYNMKEGSFMGAKCLTFTPKQGKTHSLADNLFTVYHPYTLGVTTLVESPMKLFVWN